jgi:hypothetical protein
VGVQVVPDQYERAAELLVRGIQQPGVTGLGEALALAGQVPASGVGAVDQPGPAPGVDGDPARDSRGLLRAVTRTTGV